MRQGRGSHIGREVLVNSYLLFLCQTCLQGCHCHFENQHNSGLSPLHIFLFFFSHLPCVTILTISSPTVLHFDSRSDSLPLSLTLSSSSRDQLSPKQQESAHTRRETRVFSHFPFPSSLPSSTSFVFTLLGVVRRRDKSGY